MNILEQALAAGVVAGGIWAVAYSIKSRKPEFFWKLKTPLRVLLSFIALFIFFAFFPVNRSQVDSAQSSDDTNQTIPLATGSNAAKKSAKPSSNGISLDGTLRCEPETYVTVKTIEGGNDVGSTYTLVDFDTSTMSRCDDKGCDSYKMHWQHLGNYTNIQPEEPRGFIVKVSDEGEYFEAVSIELLPLVYFGRCWNLFDAE